MKTKLLVWLIIGVGFLSACKNDDLSPKKASINGIWNLKNVSGGFVGVDIDYTEGQVIWNFNPTNTTLIVEKNIVTTGPESIYSGLDNGTYSYEIKTNGDTQTLYIDAIEHGLLMITDSTLSIDNGIASDGFITLYER